MRERERKKIWQTKPMRSFVRISIHTGGGAAAAAPDVAVAIAAVVGIASVRMATR